MIDYIWPSKWLSMRFRIGAFISLVFLYCAGFYIQIYFIKSLNSLLLIVPYFLWIIWAYIFDKSIPLQPVSTEFEEGNVSMQVFRSIVAAVVLIVTLLAIFYV